MLEPPWCRSPRRDKRLIAARNRQSEGPISWRRKPCGSPNTPPLWGTRICRPRSCNGRRSASPTRWRRSFAAAPCRGAGSSSATPSAPGPAARAISSGHGGAAVQANAAALANGALAHAFELDSLTRPGAGAHPGATVLPPALAITQERGSDGRALIAAFVAGNEVMIRIGRATGHTNEARGFHAPGTTGPFGSAAAVGRLLRVDAPMMLNALGIAGSTSAGLLEFARSGTGAMVKRLHLGRAAESGIMAASLAADGFTGPSSVLEGEAGFLKVFCTE